jgi:hypothetical protein
MIDVISRSLAAMETQWEAVCKYVHLLSKDVCTEETKISFPGNVAAVITTALITQTFRYFMVCNYHSAIVEIATTILWI